MEVKRARFCFNGEAVWEVRWTSAGLEVTDIPNGIVVEEPLGDFEEFSTFTGIGTKPGNKSNADEG